MEFEWDEEKAAANLAKHKVSFDEAKTVFDDPLYVDFYDPDHSHKERRYLIVGEIAARAIVDRLVHGERRRHALNQCQRSHFDREKGL